MKQAITRIEQRIAQAAQAAGRRSSEVTLVGVSKTHPAELVHAAYAAGVRIFGENRVQEAEEKIPQCAELAGIEWHLIGHLQRNKAKKAVMLFDVIQSVDSLALAQALSRYAIELGRAPVRILLQCNVSGEETKEGIAAHGWETDPQVRADVGALVGTIADVEGVRIEGLMTIAPYSDEPESVRGVFRSLRLLRDALQPLLPGHQLSTLSMGMSGDIDVAIGEGATMVRVGRAIFGERPTTTP
jgi:hypothetical protein